MGLVFADAHLHSNPVRGLGASRIAEKFRDVGGWFVALVALSPWHYDIDVKPDPLAAYQKTFELHVKECEAARRAGLRVSCIAGFHPADVDRLVEKGFEPHRVLEIGLRVVEAAAEMCKEGLLDGIGEVGRQHYTTRAEHALIASEVLMRAMELSRDYDCIVHMHLENAGLVTVELTDRLARRVGAKREHLLFHHSKPNVAAEAVKRGYFATLPGKEQLLNYYFTRRLPVERVMIESDYIDDPRRPCVSSCPWEIVERQKRLLSQGVVSEDTLARLNIDNVVKFYRVEPP